MTSEQTQTLRRRPRSTSGQEGTSSSVARHEGHRLPESLTGGPVDLYDSDGHHIWADVSAKGTLVISGQDLRPTFG